MMNLPRPRDTPRCRTALVCAVMACVVFSVRASAQTLDTSGASTQTQPNSPEALKKLSLDQLMNVEVTSVSREPEPYEQAPAAIDVITSDDILRSGATSIPEALRLADNLDVSQRDSHDWAISARGFNTDLGNKLLVQMDGRILYSPLFSGVFWNAQDYLLEDIDRIEVISGPGGTLWGANAVNGVINITTKSAKDTQGLYVEGGGGSELRDFAGVRYGGTLAPDVYYRVYVKYCDYGDEEYNNPTHTHASDSWRMGQGGFRIDDKVSADDNLTLQGDLYASNVNIPAGLNVPVGGGEVQQSGHNVLGRWTHTVLDDSDLSLQLYYDHTSLHDPITYLTNTQTLIDHLDTYDLDFQHRIRLDTHNQIVWGLGYRFTHDVVDETQNFAFLPPKLDQNLYSGFVQDEIAIARNVNLTIGTKIEHNSYTGFEVEPSARLQWNVNDDQMLWGAISRAVRTPSRIDRDLAEPASSPILEGSPTFVSEDLVAYELGYRAKLGSKFTTSVSTFYNDYTNLRSISETPGTLVPLYFANNLRGYTYGAEVSANYQVCDGWRLHGGYDLLEEHIRVKPGQTDYDNALGETSDPKHQFSIRSSIDLPHNIQFDTALRWVDTLLTDSGPVRETTPSYFELDARLAWRPTDRLEISVVGQNLLHAQHIEYGYFNPNEEEIVRSVYAKVSWRY